LLHLVRLITFPCHPNFKLHLTHLPVDVAPVDIMPTAMRAIHIFVLFLHVWKVRDMLWESFKSSATLFCRYKIRAVSFLGTSQHPFRLNHSILSLLLLESIRFLFSLLPTAS
jgi:hypothetical protein